MSIEISRKRVPASRGFRRRNTMSFPRALRDAIPDLHGGRVLELASINSRICRTPYAGTHVELGFLVNETGKLSGEFVVAAHLLPEAAGKLAATLNELADQAEPSA